MGSERSDKTDLPQVQFLTVAEVAARMRVSKMTVYRLVHAGELAGYQVGGVTLPLWGPAPSEVDDRPLVLGFRAEDVWTDPDTAAGPAAGREAGGVVVRLVWPAGMTTIMGLALPEAMRLSRMKLARPTGRVSTGLGSASDTVLAWRGAAPAGATRKR